MEEIVVALMSGPKDGDIITFDRLTDDKPMTFAIGRREGCDVCLSYDSQVSREHAILTYDGTTFFLEDLASTNGTFIEQTQLTGRAELAPGQLFRIGRTWLRVEPIARFTPFNDFDSDDDLPF